VSIVNFIFYPHIPVQATKTTQIILRVGLNPTDARHKSSSSGVRWPRSPFSFFRRKTGEGRKQGLVDPLEREIESSFPSFFPSCFGVLHYSLLSGWLVDQGRSIMRRTPTSSVALAAIAFCSISICCVQGFLPSTKLVTGPNQLVTMGLPYQSSVVMKAAGEVSGMRELCGMIDGKDHLTRP